MIGKKNYLTIPQAAKICSVDRSTMHRWLTSGKIKSYSTPGGHNRIQIKDLKLFFKENKIPIELDDFEKGTTKILIVDDDINVQEYLFDILSGPFIELEKSSDGFDAGVKLISFKPHLIILDLFMPNMDGFEVCKQIKGNPYTNKIKILVLTGLGTKENKSKIMSLGADAFLSKPCSKNTIIACVEQLLKK